LVGRPSNEIHEFVSSLSDVGRCALLEQMLDALPHRRMHRVTIEVARINPAHLGGFGAGARLPASSTGGEHQRAFLADLAVAGVAFSARPSRLSRSINLRPSREASKNHASSNSTTLCTDRSPDTSRIA
jgi:hypothetical protein